MKTHSHPIHHFPHHTSLESIEEVVMASALVATLLTWFALMSLSFYQAWSTALGMGHSISSALSMPGLETLEPKPSKPIPKYSQFDEFADLGASLPTGPIPADSLPLPSGH